MAFKRTAIPFFELANNAYVSAQVTFFQVDTTDWTRETTLVTLYAGKTGATTVANPLTLDGDGKFSSPVYTDERFIAVVTSTDGESHETGIFEPALSDADVAAAAASAVSAAVSEAGAAADATSASISAVAAAASAAAAVAAVGTVYASATDVTLGRLSTKVSVIGAVTMATTAGTIQIGVTNATNVETLAKASVSRVLTPANLAALNADEATTGLVRFATAAEVTTGTVTTAAVTPAGLGNTLTFVSTMIGNYTEVTTGANVTMTPNLRYRISATNTITVNLPTTMALGAANIVEFNVTNGSAITIGINGNTSIDGVTSNDTCSLYGPIVEYHAPTAAGVVRTRLLSQLPNG